MGPEIFATGIGYGWNSIYLLLEFDEGHETLTTMSYKS